MGYPQNTLPVFDNFPEVSFPQEVTPPIVDPDEGETILVAYNPAWTPVLMAACDQLRQYTTWTGNENEKKLAFDRATNLKDLLRIPFVVPERDYPTPYWDDDATADDEMPAEEQDWYGFVEDALSPPDEITFVQSAVIWLMTGFVALVAAPTLAGAAAAAITFHTVANRFVLAFNRGDIREQFRIIIDQTEYGTVDTDGMTEGDVMELTVNGLDETASHDIVIVVTNPT